MQIVITGESKGLGIDNNKASIETFKKKLTEECQEVTEEVDNLKLVYELLDVIQVSMAMIYQICKRNALDFKSLLFKHNKKLDKRGWKAEKIITFKIFNNWRD